MAACDKIWLKGRQCDQFLEWLNRVPRKTKKYAKKAYYKYDGELYQDGKDRIVIYITNYKSLKKRLQNSDVKCIRLKAKIQDGYFNAVQGVIERIFK